MAADIFLALGRQIASRHKDGQIWRLRLESPLEAWKNGAFGPRNSAISAIFSAWFRRRASRLTYLGFSLRERTSFREAGTSGTGVAVGPRFDYPKENDLERLMKYALGGRSLALWLGSPSAVRLLAVLGAN